MKSTILNLVLLLLVFMFLFAIVGYYFFGYTDSDDKENWGSFGRSMLSLFTHVTVSVYAAFARYSLCVKIKLCMVDTLFLINS